MLTPHSDNPVIQVCEEAIKESNLLGWEVIIFTGEATRYNFTEAKKAVIEDIVLNSEDIPVYSVSVRKDGMSTYYYHLFEHEFKFIQILK